MIKQEDMYQRIRLFQEKRLKIMNYNEVSVVQNARV